jgi:hypothetical protein
VSAGFVDMAHAPSMSSVAAHDLHALAVDGRGAMTDWSRQVALPLCRRYFAVWFGSVDVDGSQGCAHLGLHCVYAVGVADMGAIEVLGAWVGTDYRPVEWNRVSHELVGRGVESILHFGQGGVWPDSRAQPMTGCDSPRQPGQFGISRVSAPRPVRVSARSDLRRVERQTKWRFPSGGPRTMPANSVAAVREVRLAAEALELRFDQVLRRHADCAAVDEVEVLVRRELHNLEKQLRPLPRLPRLRLGAIGGRQGGQQGPLP